MSQQPPGRWQRIRASWQQRQAERLAYQQGIRSGQAGVVQRGPSPFGVLLLVIIGFLLLLLLALINSWWPFNRAGNAAGGNGNVFEVVNVQNTPLATLPPIGAVPPGTYGVAPRFQGFYDANGGLSRFGYAISPPGLNNGREYQWFERARLEYWPEFAGSSYEIQLGRIGAEFTTGIDFPAQLFVVSTPQQAYFRETGHAVGGGFLPFWQNNGGLRMFGYPISDELRETIGGVTYTVQYFERARLEWHADQQAPNDIQLGLLGRALYLAEDQATFR